MKYSIELHSSSDPAWIEAVLNDFDAFLMDHADCERKASAMAMSMVAKYPNRLAIIPPLIATAVEELEHFEQVYAIMEKRGVQLQHKMQKDIYAQKLLKHIRPKSEDAFLDRLLLGSVIECRGCERFKLVSEHVQDEELAKFYKNLWTSEAKHGNLFAELALEYFPEKEVYD